MCFGKMLKLIYHFVLVLSKSGPFYLGFVSLVMDRDLLFYLLSLSNSSPCYNVQLSFGLYHLVDSFFYRNDTTYKNILTIKLV